MNARVDGKGTAQPLPSLPEFDRCKLPKSLHFIKWENTECSEGFFVQVFKQLT